MPGNPPPPPSPSRINAFITIFFFFCRIELELFSGGLVSRGGLLNHEIARRKAVYDIREW